MCLTETSHMKYSVVTSTLSIILLVNLLQKDLLHQSILKTITQKPQKMWSHVHERTEKVQYVMLKQQPDAAELQIIVLVLHVSITMSLLWWEHLD